MIIAICHFDMEEKIPVSVIFIFTLEKLDFFYFTVKRWVYHANCFKNIGNIYIRWRMTDVLNKLDHVNII
jgi:hypothetical protein